MRYKKIIMSLICVSTLAAALAFQTSAATAKAIDKISIKVTATYVVGEPVPNIVYGVQDKDAEVNVYSTAKEYVVTDAEWVSSDSKDLKIGEAPKMKIWVDMMDEDEAYFKKSYSSSTVSISKGTFESVKKSGDQLIIVFETEGVKGEYDAPEYAGWDGDIGRASWRAPDVGSGYYEVQLFRGTSSVYKDAEYHGTSINFYPYMTKEGDYSFKVRTVPHTDAAKKCATKSDWKESDSNYISAEYVSDGSGQKKSSSSSSKSTTAADYAVHAGWTETTNGWMYRYPNGTYQKNSWMQYNGAWYRFDSQGKMMTGWLKENNGRNYYLNADGTMAKGWVKIGNRWRYFIMDGECEGMMYFANWLEYNGKTYFFDQEGFMVEGWYKLNGSYYYFYPGDGSLARNTTVEGFHVDQNGTWK